MISSSSTTPCSISRGFYARIKRAYIEAQKSFNGHGDSMWESISTMRSEIEEALLGGDDQKAIALLANPSETNLYYGVDNIYKHPPLNPGSMEGRAEQVVRDIQTFASILGVIRMPNPEGGTQYRPENQPLPPATEDLLTAIEARLGFKIDFPNPFPGEIGLATSRGVASTRAVQAIYQANAATTFLRNGDSSILEIGAGVGRTAYYALRMGAPAYAIVDLPTALVGQAVFLGAVLGEDAIRFDGEDRAAPIALLSPGQFERSPLRASVALNVDSMPEMDLEYMNAYFRRMKNDESFFISINHEANRHTVHLCAPLGYQRSRRLYPLRAGYVEETFDFLSLL